MNKKKELIELSNIASIVSDTVASIAFKAVVTDQDGVAILHVDNTNANQLVITISNQTSSELDISQLTGAASSTNCNITLNLPNNLLYFYTLPMIDSSSAPARGSWRLMRIRREAG